MKPRRKFPVNQDDKSIEKPQLIAPVNALDEKTAEILYKNQKTLLDNLTGFSRLVVSIKRDMRRIIDEEVARQLGDKVKLMDALYKQNIAIQNRLIKKGLISREEIAEEHEETKKMKDGK